MSALWFALLFGSIATAVVGAILCIVQSTARVRSQQRAFDQWLANEGFTKVSQPKAIQDEPFLASPIFGRSAPSQWVLDAWQKDTSLGPVRVLILKSKSGDSDSMAMVLEAKVTPAVQDYRVSFGDVPIWVAKGVGMIGGWTHVALPFDVERRYTILAAQPIEIPARLLEFLRVEDGLKFSVAATSLLVEPRIVSWDRYRPEGCNPESVESAMADLTALVPLVSVE